MPQVLRMPDEEELPPGAVRDFATFLFWRYREANRPTLRKISKFIEDGDYSATVSTETIRRMLRGETVPARWEIVEAVFGAFCALAGANPDDGEWTWDEYNISTGRTLMKRFWNRALDEPAMRARSRATEDDWPDDWSDEDDDWSDEGSALSRAWRSRRRS